MDIDPNTDGARIERLEPNRGGNIRPLEVPKPARKVIRASVFTLGDPTQIPRREWIYPNTYVRKFVTGTVAPGGVGKTGLGVVEAMAIASGRDLLGDGFKGGEDGKPLRVWFWNGEDPLDEMHRQLAAAAIHYDISNADLGGRLFLDSGRDMPIRVAYSAARDGFKVDDECVSDITRTIKENRIDVAMFDPFVAIHKATENSNEAMEAVVKALAQIADDTNCAIGVAAHTRKSAASSTGELSAEDARGGGALIAGARIVRVLNRMTKEEAAKAGIEGNSYKRYFRCGGEGDKINLAPPQEDTSWRFMESVYLPNGTAEKMGDSVRVVVKWTWPDAFDSITTAHAKEVRVRITTPPGANEQWRYDVQSPFWVGKLIAEVIGLDPDEVGKSPTGRQNKSATAKVSQILKTWIETDVLKKVQMTVGSSRKEFPCVAGGGNALS
jgi:hypothetical protein